MIGLGGQGEIKHGLKWLHSALLYANIQSHLSNPLTIQPVVARERKLALVFFFFLVHLLQLKSFYLHLSLSLDDKKLYRKGK